MLPEFDSRVVSTPAGWMVQQIRLTERQRLGLEPVDASAEVLSEYGPYATLAEADAVAGSTF